MVTTTFEAELATNNPANIFKALGGLIYVGALSVAVPAAFTTATTADLVQLPTTDYFKLGLMTKGDGLTFSRDMNQETEESWGYNEPTRTDITQDVESAKVTLQETTRRGLELFDFVDLSAVTPDSTTGEFGYSKPLISTPQFRRFVYLGVDGAGTARRYRIKIMPRAQIVAVDDLSWQQGQAVRYPLTIRANVDPTLGYAVRNILAGPGQKALNSAAGFGT